MPLVIFWGEAIRLKQLLKIDTRVDQLKYNVLYLYNKSK